MKQKRKPIPHRNRNVSGWWIASYIIRFEWYDEDRKNPRRRCLAWENTIIIKAKSRDQAYKKAVDEGRLNSGDENWDSKTGRKGKWKFEGLTGLLPIYEDLDDGAEVLWNEHSNISVDKVKRMVFKKKQLSVFDDTDRDA